MTNDDNDAKDTDVEYTRTRNKRIITTTIQQTRDTKERASTQRREKESNSSTRFTADCISNKDRCLEIRSWFSVYDGHQQVENDRFSLKVENFRL